MHFNKFQKKVHLVIINLKDYLIHFKTVENLVKILIPNNLKIDLFIFLNLDSNSSKIYQRFLKMDLLFKGNRINR